MQTSRAYLGVLLVLVGCTVPSQRTITKSWTYTAKGFKFSPLPLENPQLYYPHRALDVGKRGTPALSREQLAWLKKIEHTPYYSNKLDHMWFVTISSYDHPLTVYLGGNKKSAESHNAFWVIGEACHILFSVYSGSQPWPDENDALCVSGKGKVK